MSTREQILTKLRFTRKVHRWLSDLHDAIRDDFRLLPERAKKKYKTDTDENPGNEKKEKKLSGADQMAEHRLALRLANECGDQITVHGEESLAGDAIDVTGKQSIYVLCDAIDGTDLLERDFSNWCTAMVAFDPIEAEIVAAYVFAVGGTYRSLYCGINNRDWVEVLNSEEISFAADASSRTTTKTRDMQIHRIDNDTSLAAASICSYGQKLANTLAIEKFFNSKAVKDYFGSDDRARFYNLAGNPMMCRILDGAVDVVFELKGQAAHDVVPGAYIALKVGAVMYDLRPTPINESREIHIEDLTKILYQPNAEQNNLRYVIAANQDMGKKFLELCRESGVIE